MPRSRRERHDEDPTSARSTDHNPGWLRGVWVPWIYVAASLAMAALSLRYRSIVQAVALHAGGPPDLHSAIALVTYPFVPIRFSNWAVPAVYVVLACYLLRREMSNLRQAMLAVMVAIAGGVAYETLGPPGSIFGGGSIMAWGLTGAAAMFGILRWRFLPWTWRVYVVLVTLSVVVRAFVITAPQFALSIAALVGALLSGFWTLRRPAPALPPAEG